MLRWTTRLAILSLLVAVGAALLYVLQFRGADAEQRRESASRGERLKAVAQRLKVERRVADLIVLDQGPPTTRPATTGPAATQPAAAVRTTLLFVEYAPDGTPLPGKVFTIAGKVAHVDGMVIRLDGKFAERNGPLRGQGVALLTRLYGEGQPPDKRSPVDAPGEIPAVYRDPDPKVSEVERTFWQDVWRLTEDEAYRAEMGVRVARGDGVTTRLEPGRLYTLSLESDGALHIRSRPLQGAYREALRRQVSS